MKLYGKAIVASGHEQVSRVAAEIMRAGGNAFDAVVAAGFAAAVVEPTLTSLGGGGFLLGRSVRHGQELFFDFFVDTPGRGRPASELSPHFFPITVDFPGCAQIFNVGLGSVAVPGTLKGLVHIQKRLGRMPLAEVIAPARLLAREHIVNEQQAYFFRLLYPITTLSTEGRALYGTGSGSIKAGEIMKNPACAAFLDQVAQDQGQSFYHGEIARRIAADMADGDGLLSREDLQAFRVIEREPLRVAYRDHTLVTSPEPSMGGTLLGLYVALQERLGPYDGDWGDGGQLCRSLALMRQVEEMRATGVTTPARLQAFLHQQDQRQAGGALRLFSRGTTHISISDTHGNCAAMTCSNGEGSGYFVPGTGVMLNNMMGEDDLHPDGFHASPAGVRVSSMMSPSLLLQGETVRLVLGSGGSKRIRTAISQVLSQVVDFGRGLQEAIEAPRLHWDGTLVQVEPGFSAEALQELAALSPINVWRQRDVFFGGVHAVIPGECGAGDPRRGGSVLEI